MQWIHCLHPKNLTTGFFKTFIANSRLRAVAFFKFKIVRHVGIFA